jgi:methyltransferase (TIGR00027 family)
MIALFVFRLVQIIFIPSAVVGYVLWVSKLILFSRRSGVSATVFASFYPRWIEHQLGTRLDEPVERLMRVLPNVPPLALWLVTAPTLIGHRLTGYVPRVYRYPYEGVPPFRHQPAARTTYFDEALNRHIANIQQLVILGAGFDTRTYRLPKTARLRCFEVDTPKTQSFKREMLRRAEIDTSHVTYVPVDFLKEDWLEKLIKAGFTPDEPPFFLWEAVTMYLDRDTVENTLRKIGSMAAGTVVAFDYVSTEMLAARSPFMLYARSILRTTGEPWMFGMDMTPPARQRIASFLESVGLSLEEYRNFGTETDGKHAMAGFATAIRRT